MMKWLFKRHVMSESGQVSPSRGIMVFAGGLALLALGIGANTATSNSAGGTTTTLPASTTTTVTAATTTTSTVPGTTTSTVPGADPCQTANRGTAGFPCPTSQGGTAGVPAGATLAVYSGPTNITTCQTIDHKIINGGLTMFVANANHAGTFTDQTTAFNSSCVKITNSIITSGSPSGNGSNLLNSFYPGSTTCSNGAVSGLCGPIYLANDEVDVKADNSGYNYGLVYGNYTVWNSWIHGGTTPVSCDSGWCDFHNSYLDANSSDLVTGSAHMDAFISRGTSGRANLLDHNTMICEELHGAYGAGAGCSAPVGEFGDQSAVTNQTISNNLFLGSPDGHYCLYTGANQPAKAFPLGSNISVINNVFQVNGSSTDFTQGDPCKYIGTSCDANGNNCAKKNLTGVVADWDASRNNHWCNNNYSDGSAHGRRNADGSLTLGSNNQPLDPWAMPADNC